MHALIWCPPWAGQGGDLFFGFNSFSKHLVVQASTLRSQGWKVTVVCPSAYKPRLGDHLASLNVVEIDSFEAIDVVGGWNDPSASLYREPASNLSSLIAEWLQPKLPKSVDFVLLWETPVPYLRILYPEATIISQMPGAFARAPYPQTTVFDPVGLYRDSSLVCATSDILVSHSPSALAKSFTTKVRKVFYRFPYSSKNAILSRTGRKRLALLPLQITDHYAFNAETGFSSQAEFCTEAITRVSDDTAIYVTEYVSRLYKDQVMTPEFVAFLQRRRSDLVFDAQTSEVPSVSQHVLQFVDEVVTATSGLCFQAMAWDIPVNVVGNTHLIGFDKAIVDTPEKREKVLSYILTRHQPMSKLVLSDGKFLTGLLEEIRGRRKRPILERLPDFSVIDPNYSARLMRELRPQETKKTFFKMGFSDRSGSQQRKFSEILTTKKPKLISFDLFDTLVARGFEQPADLYAFLEKDIRQSGVVTPFDFAEKRRAAELMARLNAKSEEISLDDIYKEFAQAEGLNFAEVRQFRDRELEIESNACQVRPIGRELYSIAKDSGITTCVTSDMYLPRATIDTILRANGYGDTDQIHLSSEVGLTKKSGSLFSYIAKQNRIRTGDIVHVGDNQITDIESAVAAGVTAFHVPRAVETLWKHDRLANSFGKRQPITSLGRSVTVAAIARTLFDDDPSNDRSLSGGDPWRLGYATLGPLVYGFVVWLRTIAVDQDIKTLHFLSREGRIFKDVFDRIELASPTGIRSNYLWGSRRAIRTAQMQSLQDILEVGRQTVDRTASLATLLSSRFGLDLSKIDVAKIREVGFESLQHKGFSNTTDKTKLLKLLAEFQEDILEISTKERKAYKSYLMSEGLFDSDDFAVVDVGWHANMQGSLGQMLGKPITGYYFSTLDPASRWTAVGHRIHAYYLEGCTITANKPVLSERLMIENLLCDVTPTIVGVGVDEDGRFFPRYAGAVLPNRMQLIRAVQDGVRSFADDLCRVLGSQAGTTELRPDIALPILDEFLINPHYEDARLFEGHEIEDAFSGAQVRYLLSPFEKGRPTTTSYWRAGETAIREWGALGGGSRSGRGSIGTTSLHRAVMPLVRPFVKKMGNAKDVEEFDQNPAAFFEKLTDARYRRIGAFLFPR
jgi:predicted HAD superfamily hydrolase